MKVIEFRGILEMLGVERPMMYISPRKLEVLSVL